MNDLKKSSPKKVPTQADVARLAGVSQAMVSYVLNDNSNISVPPETRQRILDAIEELGYMPNKVARSLRTRKTKTIACVVPDITNPFHTVFARGIQDVVERHGYDLILYNTDRIPHKERASLRLLQQGRVDGIIMTALHLTAEDFLPLLRLNIPVVVQGPNVMPLQVEGFPLDSVHVNDVAAARAAVSYLIERGHRRIGLIAGQKDTPPRRQRELGYWQTLAEYGLAVDEKLIQDGDFREEGGYQGMRALLALSPRPTAVFAASDLMAVGALVAIKEAGLKAPDDVAVVGFDDIPIAKLISPALTTIAQFEDKLGQRSAEMLFDRLNGTAPEEGRREEMPYQLVVRDSA
ncbi:MAG: LacI family transcriptional regulator [Chloroflexi bacterium]|nr:LacI family transcriptional regulator [Chloroflexota bacterium]MCI0574935.1 LacI family transcriptional regulator [Chloroflexota bacterium]MCI0645845.1 LacI family transcriptional regulator [Chloroflexota bacterium]MCI0725700.1 LacI family transcriptional regulator [Chloroflexota bacterium]